MEIPKQEIAKKLEVDISKLLLLFFFVCFVYLNVTQFYESGFGSSSMT